MSTWYATLITKNHNNSLIAGTGSFQNISIDGRLSLESAIKVAHETFLKEARHLKVPFVGFAIEKTTMAWKFKNPNLIGGDYQKLRHQASDIKFLLN